MPGSFAGTRTLVTVRVGFLRFVITQTLLSPGASVTLPFAAQSPPIDDS